MDYFKRFPTVEYRLSEVGSITTMARTVPNMTVKLQLDIFEGETLAYQTYRIKDRDRPDTIAAEMYGASRYAWVIMLANNMRDWYDWPLSDEEFRNYMNKKYESSSGIGDGDSVSRATIAQYIWITEDGRELSVDEPAYQTLAPHVRRTVTVYDQEYAANDSRRIIRLPTMDELGMIIRQMEMVLEV